MAEPETVLDVVSVVARLLLLTFSPLLAAVSADEGEPVVAGAISLFALSAFLWALVAIVPGHVRARS